MEYTYGSLKVSVSKFSNEGAVWALLLDPKIKRNVLLSFV